VKQKHSLERSVVVLTDTIKMNNKKSSLWEVSAVNAENKIQSLEDELSIWYRNPFIVGTLSLVTGVAVTGVVIATLQY